MNLVFLKEQLEKLGYLGGMTILQSAPDIRASTEVVVSREGTIHFETNDYSVPARFLGAALTLKYHPLSREVTVYKNGLGILSCTLLPKGAHGKSIRESDRKELFALWQKQNGGLAKQQVTRTQPPPAPDGSVRNPIWYETLLAEAMV
ncbi:MAG TPA: hypothetical protein PLV76_00415 [Spirochaetales bacterium]|nr:hypothetical protein [Spirochaetales bacterium]